MCRSMSKDRRTSVSLSLVQKNDFKQVKSEKLEQSGLKHAEWRPAGGCAGQLSMA